jgi:hypothetical protein
MQNDSLDVTEFDYMEITKNELSPYAKDFFDKLKNNLNEKIYFFGSIQRSYYFMNSSDIDVDIFTENIDSTISKLQNFLNVKKNKFKKIIYRTIKTKKIVYGYKIEYEDLENNFFTEISIFDKKYKKNVLIDHSFKINLPFYITFFLIVLKFFYYKLHIVSDNIYKYLKNYIISILVDGHDKEHVSI